MPQKREVLKSYIQKNKITQELADKVSSSSISTPNYSYHAFRVGNSIGDILELAMDFILAKTICDKFKLHLYTVEHCEFHSTGITEEDLDVLFQAAKSFELHKKDTDFSKIKKDMENLAYNRFKEVV